MQSWLIDITGHNANGLETRLEKSAFAYFQFGPEGQLIHDTNIKDTQFPFDINLLFS